MVLIFASVSVLIFHSFRLSQYVTRLAKLVQFRHFHVQEFLMFIIWWIGIWKLKIGVVECPKFVSYPIGSVYSCDMLAEKKEFY